MATTSSPYGLRVIGRMGPNQAFSAYEDEHIAMTTNSASALAIGDIVVLSSGQPAAGNATPTTTIAAATSPIGICTGVSFVTPTGQYVHKTNFLPAGAVTAGYTDIKVYYISDPDVKFAVQADGAVTTASLWRNAALKNFGQATAAAGSKIQLDSGTVAATNTLAVKIVGFVNIPGTSTPGDAYTDVICIFNAGVHRANAPAAI